MADATTKRIPGAGADAAANPAAEMAIDSSEPCIDANAARLCAALSARAWHLALAESCTGGGLAEAITRVAGSSACFWGGFVTYANATKTALLGVSSVLLAEQGAVSEAVARAMAEGARQRTRADMALAITGIAGPSGGSADKPVGTVCFAWVGPHTPLASMTCHFCGGRQEIRRQAVAHALTCLLGMVRG